MGYMYELTPVEFKLSEALVHGVVVRFSADTLVKIYETVNKQGLTLDALIRQWVVERLDE